MPKKAAKKKGTTGNRTCQDSEDQSSRSARADEASSRPSRQTRKRTREEETRHTQSRTRKPADNTERARVNPRSRTASQARRKQSGNDGSPPPRRQQTPQPPSPKRRRPSRGLTEADIPRIVDAFIAAQEGRQTRHQPPDSDEYSDMEDDGASVTDEEVSGKEYIVIAKSIRTNWCDR